MEKLLSPGYVIPVPKLYKCSHGCHDDSGLPRAWHAFQQKVILAHESLDDSSHLSVIEFLEDFLTKLDVFPRIIGFVGGFNAVNNELAQAGMFWTQQPDEVRIGNVER